jgi:hypothetical protein
MHIHHKLRIRMKLFLKKGSWKENIKHASLSTDHCRRIILSVPSSFVVVVDKKSERGEGSKHSRREGRHEGGQEQCRNLPCRHAACELPHRC